MLHYISFGSGSSGNCSLLFSEDEAVFIDAGVGIRALKKAIRSQGVPAVRPEAILITHDHADHIRSVGSLSKEYGLPVYATRKVHAGIGRNWCVRCKIAPERVRNIDPCASFRVGHFEITPFAVPHDSSENVGYCIEYKGVTFVLMTDIGHLTDAMKPFIARANYLVIEADFEKEMLLQGPYSDYLKKRILGDSGHQSNEECGRAIAENATPKLKQVWLCHLSDENNHPELAEKTVKQVLREHGIIAGPEPDCDFALDVLKRATPSEIFDLG